MTDGQTLSKTGSSLAVRLGVLAAGGSLAALLVAGTVMAALQQANAERALDARLAVFVNQLFADYVNDDVFDGTVHFADLAFGQPGSGWYWVVAEPISGAPRLASSSYFDPLPPPPDLSARIAIPDGPAQGMFTETASVGEQRLRVVERFYTLQGDEFLIRVTAPIERLRAEVNSFRFALGITLGLMWLVLLALAYVQVRVGLRPLEVLQGAVSKIRTGERDKVTGLFPQEVSPLVDELNGLLEAKEAIVSRSRHHVGNLAHGLKTPLAAILNAAAGPQDRDTMDLIKAKAHAIDDRVRVYLDRARRAATASSSGQSAHVRGVVDPLVRTMDKLSRDKDLRFEITVNEQFYVRTERGDLEEMLGNLLENACRYARSTVRLSATNDAPIAGQMSPVLRIDVDDDGTGLSDAQIQTVLQRGRRLDESEPGSGLGLSIVLEMAELYGGALSLNRSDLGGLSARLILPAAPVRPDS
ncbi:MAG: sensor histidine kinase [Pseudomonadota bacterium]